MRHFSQILYSLAACFLLVSGAQGAVTLNVDGSGHLIGAQNVDVGGTLYDVEFVDGTCVALFDGCDNLSDFTFTTGAAASLASTALLDQVFIGSFDDTPNLINGITAICCGFAFTPYGLKSAGFLFNRVARNFSAAFGTVDDVQSSVDSVTADTTGSANVVYAVWSPSVSNAAPVFLESSGQVVVEAEHFSSRTAVLPANWSIVPAEADGFPSQFANHRGDGYIQALPDILGGSLPGGGLGNPPYVDYLLRISNPGTYQLYVRWDSHDNDSDSFYVNIVELFDGIDGSVPDWYRYASGPDDRDFATRPWHGIAGFERTDAIGNETSAVWAITATGDYTLRFSEREDGAAIDAFILQFTSLPAPTASGPPESETTDNTAPLDTDGDGVLDISDNCLFTPNADQSDNDSDGDGDACDADDDNDSVSDGTDNCPLVSNVDQSNVDNDAFGDACDADLDGDSVANEVDNCPANSNLDQTDTDGDLEGDECDTNDDNDMHLDVNDNCPTIINDDQADLDEDGIGDVCDADIDNDGINNNAPDNCPLTANPGQDDTDGDSQGDACDSDDDNDTYLDVDDNCPLIPNDQSDLDGNGVGDACDGDLDGDGHDNFNDNCPAVANSSQNDLDFDGLGDACDADIDGDGVTNSADTCASTPPGAVIDPSLGCSIIQLCPCEEPRGTTTAWRNHGKYVSCIAKTSENFVERGLITDTEKDVIVSTAAGSSCGNKK